KKILFHSDFWLYRISLKNYSLPLATNLSNPSMNNPFDDFGAPSGQTTQKNTLQGLDAFADLSLGNNNRNAAPVHAKDPFQNPLGQARPTQPPAQQQYQQSAGPVSAGAFDPFSSGQP
ncbi:unnamed protein product, partial [Heterosigma akashiwo]